jgi:hypothetical protein
MCARRVCIEPIELRIKVVLRRAFGGDEFEAFAQRSIRCKALSHAIRGLEERLGQTQHLIGVEEE